MEAFFEIFNTNLLAAMIRLSTPITLAAVGAVICERSGIVNIAMEGIMIVGAFFAVVGTFITGNPWMGMLIGMLAGGVFSLIHALGTVTLHLNHVVSGAVVNILAFGLTEFLMVVYFGHPGTSPRVPANLYSLRLYIPGLSDIPVVGRILFNQTPIVYISFLMVAFFTWFLFKTKTGLHIRAAGEHPMALETIGVSVYKMRYLAIFISGLTSGLGGAFLSIENAASFTEGMTNGRGFIALAANISGGWHPIGAFIASLFFGFADALQVRFQITKIVDVPAELFIIFPYIATIIAIAGLVRRSRPPAKVGEDFILEKAGE
ncbi:MAG: ABC transporter permease [Spirochaetaceae bacterium]